MSVEKILTKSDLQSVICESQLPVRPGGGGTQQEPRVAPESATEQNAQSIDMTAYRGIVAYEPSEYLISAKSGTSLLELQSALAQHGQYLPFDPWLVEAGATLGGRLASGLSGPCRMLYGGLRDFVMEVEFIDGLGQAVRGGGKVVKNAAGFDFPKLMVGSLGRLGILTEATLKVFPQPAASATVRLRLPSLELCQRVSQAWLGLPLPIAGLNFAPTADHGYELQVRFSGPAGSLEQVVLRSRQAAEKVLLRSCAGEEWVELQDASEELAFWQATKASLDSNWIRAPLAAQDFISCSASFAGCELFSSVRYWCGGTLAWLRRADAVEWSDVDAELQSLGCAAQRFQWYSGEKPWLGNCQWQVAASRIQKAMDPKGRFETFG